jgi:two-component system, cell cycle response regulator
MPNRAEGRMNEERSMMVDYHPSPNRKVLVIDDSDPMRRLVRHYLRPDDFEVLEATTGQEGLTQAQQNLPDVILLDVGLPDVDGFEMCRRLKSDLRTMLIPIIFITAHTATDEKVKGLDLGAHDYMTKPFHPVELRARVRSAFRFKHLLDLLERKARIDPLTGLYNSLFFNEQLKEEIGRANRLSREFSVVMADVDHFKKVNDTYGHPFGDTVLVRIADALSARPPAVIARLGGEEFAALLRDTPLKEALVWAEDSRTEVASMTFTHHGQPVQVTSSFGVAGLAQFPDLDPAKLMEAADKALYLAKHTGRNRVCLWEEAAQGHNGGDAP